MNELPYPSDLTAAQWALLEPLLPAPKRKRRVDLRKITNAILYVLKGGISWRMLPRDFAPWKTVYHYFRLVATPPDCRRTDSRSTSGMKYESNAAGIPVRVQPCWLDSQSVATHHKSTDFALFSDRSRILFLIGVPGKMSQATMTQSTGSVATLQEWSDKEERGRTCYFANYWPNFLLLFWHAHAHPLVMRCWRGRICQIADKILLSARSKMCCNFVVEPKGRSMIGNSVRRREQTENEAVQ